MKNTWSDKLLEETRNVFNGDFVPRDEFVYMKNINGSFGKIHITDWLAKKLLIQDKGANIKYSYANVDELIASGWVVD